MENQGFSKIFQGSTQVWVGMLLLSLFSLLPVYSGGGTLSHFSFILLSWAARSPCTARPTAFLEASRDC